jgi:hypothetical protein
MMEDPLKGKSRVEEEEVVEAEEENGDKDE